MSRWNKDGTDHTATSYLEADPEKPCPKCRAPTAVLARDHPDTHKIAGMSKKKMREAFAAIGEKAQLRLCSGCRFVAFTAPEEDFDAFFRRQGYHRPS